MLFKQSVRVERVGVERYTFTFTKKEEVGKKEGKEKECNIIKRTYGLRDINARSV